MLHFLSDRVILVISLAFQNQNFAILKICFVFFFPLWTPDWARKCE